MHRSYKRTELRPIKGIRPIASYLREIQGQPCPQKTDEPDFQGKNGKKSRSTITFLTVHPSSFRPPPCVHAHPWRSSRSTIRSFFRDNSFKPVHY